MIPYQNRRKIALAILASEVPLTRKAGSFLGQCAVDDLPLTDRQSAWFEQLAEKAGVALEGCGHE